MTKDMTTIGEITKVFDGPHATPKKTEAGPYFLSISSLENGVLDLSKSAHLNEEDFLKWTKRVTPQENDLLFSYETRLGEAALMKKGVKACLGRRMGLLRPNTEVVLPKFLLYAYLSPAFQEVIKANTIRGATVDRIALTELPDFKIRIPPIEEQNCVASILSTLDAKIDLNNKINAELEAMAKTLYDYWFVQFDFPISKEQAKAMGKPHLEGKPYKTSGGKMVYDEILKREIPEGWEGGYLDNLGQIVGGSTPSTTVPENFTKDGIPWLTPNDLSENTGNKFISKGNIDVTEVGMKSASLKNHPAGTVLLSSRAPIGYMAIARTDLTTNQGFKSFVPNKGYTCEFIYYGIKNSLKSIVQNSSGSTFKEVSGTVLKTVKAILPPIQLSELYSKKAGSIFQKQDCLELENTQLIDHRDWLLPMLMNGQVKVHA